MDSVFPASRILVLLFRRPIPDDGSDTVIERRYHETALSGIRCPLCKWRPRRESVWTCWDCDHPEHFYGGCGTEWNTFETRGLCPMCQHQWKWTSCLSCWGWSPHEEWYEKSD